MQLTEVSQRKQSETRQLTKKEFKQFLTFISQNKIDRLGDKGDFSVFDGTEHQYLHCSKDEVYTFYMNNPSRYNSLYSEFVEKFLELVET